MAPVPAPVLAAAGLRKRFGAVEAVRGIDLDVAPGERVGLLGPNGAGKTTTLLMLLGAVSFDAGSVEICGSTLPRHRTAALGNVGFVAGYLPFPDRLRVHEALTTFAGFSGLDRRAAAEAISSSLERFGIPHLRDRYCMELSSGQRTLVGIIKATLHRPRLLVLDEPTASLDPDVADRVRAALLEVNAVDGTALLVTSHNMDEVERLCERVVFITRGEVVANDTPSGIKAQFGRADLEAVFLHLAREDAP